jgi:hypothetical protein
MPLMPNGLDPSDQGHFEPESNIEAASSTCAIHELYNGHLPRPLRPIMREKATWPDTRHPALCGDKGSSGASWPLQQ